MVCAYSSISKNRERDKVGGRKDMWEKRREKKGVGVREEKERGGWNRES